MYNRQRLQIPGPTNVPDRLLRSMSKQLINHRGPEFEKLIKESVSGMKKIFRTENNDILFFPSSGSGGLESVIVNMFSSGDTILVACHGLFSERVADIAYRYGLNVIKVEKAWGKAIKAEDLRSILIEDKDYKIKGLFLPHNETTSGVKNDLESVSIMLKEVNHPTLLLVDAVSSLASMPLEVDKWNIDIVVTGSQKGLMLPPGLSIICLSEKAWEQRKTSTLPKWYWDFNAVKEKMKIYQLPYTPPISLFYGLRESLDILEEEGLENVWNRHKLVGYITRESVKAMGLELFAEQGYESDTVTAVKVPKALKYNEIETLLREKFGVIIGGGLANLKGKIFRIGHLGDINVLDIYTVLGALEFVLLELGHKLEVGTSAKAISKVLKESGYLDTID